MRPRRHWARLDGHLTLQPNRTLVAPGALADRLAVRECFERWGIAFDEGCIDVMESLFTSDGVYTVVIAGGERSVQIDHAVGPQEIGERVAQVLAAQQDQRRHFVSNVLVQHLE
jgi:hypothetical protein